MRVQSKYGQRVNLYGAPGKETLWVIDTTTVFGFYHKMDKVAGPKGPGSDV